MRIASLFTLSLVAWLVGCVPDGTATVRCASDQDCAVGYSCSPSASCIAAPSVDAGAPASDAGANDSGAPDAGANDAGANDAGTNDAGANDAGANDAGANDAGANDAGANDAGANDAGANDAGANDAGANDAGANDGGANDGGTTCPQGPDGALIEVCDGIDNDCDGVADNGDVCPCPVRYREDRPLEPYLFCDHRRRWTTARDLCASVGYHLIVLEDSDEEAWFVTQASGATYLPDPHWLGLSDLDNEGTFVWEDGTELSDAGYASWTNGDPSLVDYENCVWRVAQGWQDITCNTIRTFVCEVDVAANEPEPVCVDGDQDGRGAGCALGPDCDDADTNAWQWLLGHADHDQDGLSVGPAEWVCSGDQLPPNYRWPASAVRDCDDTTNPAEGPCGSCHQLFRGQNTYLFCNASVTFEGARSVCTENGMSLFMADSAAEDEWVQRVAYDLRDNGLPVSWWIGAKETQSEPGQYEIRWLDGTLADPLAWNHTLPDFNNGESCMKTDLFGWGDSDCLSGRGYICKDIIQ